MTDDLPRRVWNRDVWIHGSQCPLHCVCNGTHYENDPIRGTDPFCARLHADLRERIYADARVARNATRAARRKAWRRWVNKGSVCAGLIVGGVLAIAWSTWVTDNLAIELIATIIIVSGYLVGLTLLGSEPSEREE